MSKQAVIIINPYCHQGRGWKRWLSVKDAVHQRITLPLHEIVIEKGMNLTACLWPKLNATTASLLFSAGGDGTVHYLVNNLLTLEKTALDQITLGAIGLGSSNDFLKPFDEKIKGIPVRINHMGGSILHDAGLATYDADGERKKFFIVNASIGVTAEANWNFNNAGTFLRFLKKHSTAGAIACTAVSTILRHRNTPCSIKFNGNELNERVSNINVLKIPYVSGSFFYNQAIARDDGRLGLNVCLNMSKRELLSILAGLQKGIFPLSQKTISVFTKEVSFAAHQPFVFECDGETEKTTSLHLRILPNALSVLKS